MESPFSQIPPEILLEIFQRVVPPSRLLDPTACLTMQSVWNKVSKQKKVLTLVCRAWYTTAITLLYDDICIFRPHQLYILVQSLEALGQKVHVKTVHITPYIPYKYLTIFLDLLRRIVHLCPSIDTLDISPGAKPPSQFIQAFPIPPNLTCLTLGPLVEEEDCEFILEETARTLTHLTLYNVKPDHPMDFLSLIELNLTECRNGEPILSGCSFPRLERASFTWAPYSSALHPDRLFNFCKEHGKNLKMLQIQESLIGGASFYKRLKNNNDYIMLQRSLDLCPTLEHIVIHPHAIRGSLYHSKVQWVDIWEPPLMVFSSDPSSRFENLKRYITKESFPSLRGIRTIASVLRPFNPSIPLIFPPQLRDDPGLVPFSTEFEGFHIRHDVDRIYSPPHESFDRICDSDHAWPGSDSWEQELRCNNDDLAPTEICSDVDEDDGDEYVPSSSSEDEGDEDDEDDASSLSREEKAEDANDEENRTSSTNEDEEDEDDLSYISGDDTSSYVSSPDYDELMAQFSSMEIE